MMRSMIWAHCALLTSNTTSSPEGFAQGITTFHTEVITEEAPVSQQAEPASFFPSRKYLVTVVAYPGVLNGLFIIPPKPLNASGTFYAVSDEIPPSTLYSCRHIVPISIAHGFQSEELRMHQTSEETTRI
jgi:hypothetical protein